ncbi:SDR family oxidoreductase [Paremcibacter congregatus]|uniref:Short-chain dehydrogenase n=1 Tax=Paremcibacter congregatus TaxID=2043170 RepID=A0A2G4YQE2_9PROT|nr:SDR family oxidoreductase [Paremcibacter congregatus]PHZ84507.1 short-chain dehydrogenase [Paremcibacter congregatus]QDE28726.1 SDR family oxidoreductase [Paremcibacter congregatus]
MQQLQDKVAIITGASSGIGRSAARLFAVEGAALVIGARRQAELDSLREEITTLGGRSEILVGDVREEGYAQALVDIAEQKFGGLDISFNTAGILGELGSATDMSETAWRECLDVNLTGAFLLAKHHIPALRKKGGGAVIFTSSFVGHTTGMAGMAAYAAAKAGLIGLTRVLAVEHGGDNIRVNTLCPGGTDTDMARSFANSPEALSYVKSLHALGRLATPEEIAKVALFLASDAAKFITGQALFADGGISIFKA